MNTMADGAAQRLVAEMGQILFGQPGLNLMELAVKVKGMQIAPDGQSAALHAAVSAIYFDDSSDYLSALWSVVCALNPAVGKLLERDPNAAYEATKPESVVAAAQPSPAGQGDALTQQQVCDRFGFLEGLVTEATYRRIADEAFHIQQEALAARQPVAAAVKDSLTGGGGQEPVAWMTHHAKPMLFPTKEEASAYCEDGESPIPLYESPPAQAVDLGQFRPAVEAFLADAEREVSVHEKFWGHPPDYSNKHAKRLADAKSLLSLIHSNASAGEPNTAPNRLTDQAQAVDLGQFRDLAEFTLQNAKLHNCWEKREALARNLLALIDNEAVGNGN